MTDMNLTEIVCVLDRSGSMATIIDDAIGGFNAMLKDQQKQSRDDGTAANMTIAMFDHQYMVVAENKPVERVEPFCRRSYVPRGSTALLDAVGRTIDDVGRRLQTTQEEKRPGKLLFIILTDGHENASTQYNHDQIAERIKHQQERYQWEFIYLSADINAFDHAASINIPTSVRFTNDAKSIGSTYSVISDASTQYRSRGAKGMSIRNCSTDLSTVDITVESGETSTPEPTNQTQ